MSDRTPAALERPRRGEVALRSAEPLERLRAEHSAMLEWARACEWLLARRVIEEVDRASLEENMRALRAMLPRHLVGEERSLYAEIELADPSAGPLLRQVRGQHLEIEKSFSRLQGLALARCVDPEGRRAQRKAIQAAHEFRERLEALFSAKEQGPFALAARALSPEAMERVADALEAALMREQLKQMQGR